MDEWEVVAMTTVQKSSSLLPKEFKDEQLSNLLKSIFDAIPSPAFLFSEELIAVAANQYAVNVSGDAPLSLLRRKTGDVFGCFHSRKLSLACEDCPRLHDCVFISTLHSAFKGVRVVKVRAKLGILKENQNCPYFCLITASPLELDGQRYCLMILEDIGELVELQGILPICSYCKKIRNDERAWQQMEGYLSSHLDVTFSHGVCPDCLKVQMAELEELKKNKG
jgi:hypothetical protein